MSNLYKLGNILVYLVSYDASTNSAVVRSTKNRSLFNVSFDDLIPVERKKKSVPKNTLSNDACPDCRTSGYIPGIECPGCGKKEGFREWLNNEIDTIQ